MAVVQLARSLTATPLARGYERGGRNARKRPTIPWTLFDRARYPEPALALAYDAASKLAKGEYSAIELFARLTAGAITLTFFTYAFVNMGMVSGILPVVGVPLPMISYGGTALLSILAGFGILMSISTHKQLVSS